MNKEPIYVIGHQHPDTDAIASAIAYATLKQALGVPAMACRLGELNPETAYVLQRFHFEEPPLLKDARKTLQEISLDEAISLSPESTIREAMELMREKDRSYLAVCDHEKTLIGLVSKNDLGKIALGDSASSIELLKKTSIQNIAKTIDGKVIYDDAEVELNGKVSIIAMTSNGIADYDIAKRLVIIGDDISAQKELIRKGAGALIIVWSKEVNEEVLTLAKENHCPLILSGHGSMNTSRYISFASPIELVMKQEIVSFSQEELAEDVAKKMGNYRFDSFPVLDTQQHLVAYVSRKHVMNYDNKSIILVDHNEFSQSVKAIEKAQILEVVDHHRINDFSTSQPIRYRAEVIGSTASIIYKMYQENQLEIPQNIASILLAALLSDTMIFQSPTTTEEDKVIAEKLAEIAHLDIQTFGKEMFAASADIEGRSILELIDRDVKPFTIVGEKVMISQLILPEVTMLTDRSDEVQVALDQFCKESQLDLAVLAITGIIDQGSAFYSSGKWAYCMTDAFPNKEGEEHSLQEGVLSRKKQFVPMVTAAIAKNK